jgi:uncharacterized protein (TIGR02996 family)
MQPAPHTRFSTSPPGGKLGAHAEDRPVTDRDALMRAICDSPDDDAPRLVYADWLDENGDPRQAEFIREHIAIGKLPYWKYEQHPETTRLLQLWRDLRKWRFLTGGDWLSFNLGDFVRGFNTRWRGSVPDFLKTLPTPWRFGPITAVTFEFDRLPGGRAALAATVAGLATLPRVTEVTLFGPGVPEEWAATLRRGTSVAP